MSKFSFKSSHRYPKRGGIYIHIPFCRKKCPYCGFYSITDLSLRKPLARAIIGEMRLVESPSLPFDSIYFGGGTPSLLNPREIGEIVAAAHRSFSIRSTPEVTVEINPGTVNVDQLKGYREAGVNRVSIGVQSFQETQLITLGRLHTNKESERCIQATQKTGIENIGLDLIFGIPGQTKALWQSDLKQAVSYSPDHLSCYLLTYEPDTLFEDHRKAGRITPVDDRRAVDLMTATYTLLSSSGYIRYEISNYAKSEDKISRHNSKYWSFAPYIGLGPSAHSFSSTQRWWNHADVNRYISDVDAGRLPVAGKETLTREQQMTEAIYLGLRTIDGIDIETFDEKFKENFAEMFNETIRTLQEERIVAVSENRIALTPKGIVLHDSVVAMFINSIN